MTISKSSLSDAFSVCVLFLATGALTTVFVSPMSPGEIVGGSPLMQGIWSSIYLIVLIRAAQIRYMIGQTLRQNKLLVGLVALAVISSLWSGSPSTTLRRSIATALSTLFAVDLSIRYTLRKQIQLISIAVGSAVILSAVLELVYPGLVPKAVFGVIQVDEATWNGLFPHKNGFGHVLAIGTVCVLSLGLRTRVSYMLSGICFAGILALTAAAQSRTSLLISLLMVSLWPLLTVLHWRQRTRRTLGMVISLIAVGLLYVGLQAADALAAGLGRSSDMTGRTEIWALSVDSILDRPVLGFGLSGFWDVSEDSARIRSVIGWDTPYAHSAYIDTTLQLGVVGLILCAGIALVGVTRAVSYTRHLRTSESMWPLACILFSLSYGITESDFLTSNWIFWMIFVSAVCTVSTPAVRPALPSYIFTNEGVAFSR